MIRAAVPLLAVLLAPAATSRPVHRASAPAPEVATVRAHDIHLSFTRIAVEGGMVICRVRVFRDDLERAMARHTGRGDWKATATPAADSAFRDYFARAFPLKADGTPLTPRVTASGADRDETDQPMWWYLVVLEAARPIASLSLRAGLLFELFDDQRNIVQLQHSPGDQRFSFYFVPSDTREQVAKF